MYKKKKQIKQGVKIKTLRDLYDFIDQNNVDNLDVQISEVPDQCGMRILHELRAGIRPVMQAAYLLSLLDGEDCSQIILTDTVKSGKNPSSTFYDPTENYWKATKKVCARHKQMGPITINPNTGRKIAHFTVTKDLLVEIANQKTNV